MPSADPPPADPPPNVGVPRGASFRRRILALAAAAAVGGCSQGLFDPQGPIAAAQKLILYDSLGIMLAIIIPTIAGTLWVAWWYRASNKRAQYLPDFQYSGRVEMVVWSIPVMTILLLGGLAWIASHQLDPFRPIESPVKPVRIQVVSLDWKWLFILPDQGIASVNLVLVPAGTPLAFELTSSGVMNGFLVPQLGSMIAVMPGMRTELHLLAENPGAYSGLSTQFSGDGFSGMSFTVQAVPPDQFEQQMAAAKGKGPTLDDASYAQLAEPSSNVKPMTYGSVSPDLFQKILRIPGFEIAATPPTTPGQAGHAKPPKEE